MPRRLIIGTRTSRLAMWQTHHVMDLLVALWPGLEWEARSFTTKGDKTLHTPLPEIGGKGLFTAELEDALRNNDIDLAVHSLKDLPVENAPGLTLGAITSRADVSECLVAGSGVTLDRLPRGAVVGTSSIRRQAQLLRFRSDLHIRPIRGNVETRIRKVMTGEYDATLLAFAGVQRLGLTVNISQIFGLDTMLPAPGQGALAVQCRSDDEEMLELLARIEDKDVRMAVTAERAFLEALGGGCSAPIGAYAVVDRSEPKTPLQLRAVVTSPDGTNSVFVDYCGSDPRDVGTHLAERAIKQGAGDILAALAVVGKATTTDTSGRSLPLLGKRIVVTRSRNQASSFCDALRRLGADAVEIPVIRIAAVENPRPIDAAISSMHDYDWLVFTSANGVEMFWRHLAENGTNDLNLVSTRVAAVGPSTADALVARGVKPDFVPGTFVGEAIAEEMKEISGKRICLLRAEAAREDLARLLRRRGAQVDDIAVYRTVPETIKPEQLAELEKGVDAITCTSGSTVRYFVAAIKSDSRIASRLANIPYACIGPVTADVARELNLNVAAVANTFTTDGLADALIEYFSQENSR